MTGTLNLHVPAFDGDFAILDAGLTHDFVHGVTQADFLLALRSFPRERGIAANAVRKLGFVGPVPDTDSTQDWGAVTLLPDRRARLG